MNRVAVVILNWNGVEMLRQFLPSVVECSAEQATVYVADNGSDDESLQVLSSEFSGVRVIALDANYGFAEGYNRAIAAIENEYVVLLNSDVEVTPQWLEPMLRYMDAHPAVAACQPKIKSWHNKQMFEYAGAAGGYIDAYGYPFCRGRMLSHVEEDKTQYDAVAPIFWASGAALFIRTADYKEVGGLDDRFFAHMEEIDLCWRLRARGREIVCVPQSVVYHVGGGTLKKENPRKTFLNFRNNLLMLYKNTPTEQQLKKVLRVRFFLDHLAAFQFLLKRDMPNYRAVLAARREFSEIRNDFVTARHENLQKTIVAVISEQFKGSILVNYYLFCKRTYSKLTH